MSRYFKSQRVADRTRPVCVMHARAQVVASPDIKYRRPGKIWSSDNQRVTSQYKYIPWDIWGILMLKKKLIVYMKFQFS